MALSDAQTQRQARIRLHVNDNCYRPVSSLSAWLLCFPCHGRPDPHRARRRRYHVYPTLHAGKIGVARTRRRCGREKEDIDEFKELKNPLVPKKVELERQILALEKTKLDRLEPLRQWIYEANQAAHWL